MRWIPLIAILVLLPFSPLTQAEQITGKVVSITDGDTLTLRANKKQVTIRLAEIDTPEKGQPWGNKAKKALSKKVSRKTVVSRIRT